MMVQGQLGQARQTPFLETPVPQQLPDVGLLGNQFIQFPAKITYHDSFSAAFLELLAPARPTFKLALLKRQRFTPEERQQRIAASLAAVNGAQPIDLTLAQWKEIVEEVQDEE